jgi:hypothetical protein
LPASMVGFGIAYPVRPNCNKKAELTLVPLAQPRPIAA